MTIRMTLRAMAVVAAGCLCFSTTACHSSATKRAFSPIIGSWKLNSAPPEPDANLPRFTALVFRRSGALEASYVAAGGALAGVLKGNSKSGEEHDTYTLSGSNGLKIIEGSRALEYTYEVRDDKLFLKTPGSDSSTVFVHVAASESGLSGDAHAPAEGNQPAAGGDDASGDAGQGN